MQVHLVDATYELFRAHYAPRPPVLGRDGVVLSGVSGLVDQLLYLLREEGATHVGCATDRVIESFRNDLFPGYKSSAGMPPELLAQFPIAEAAIEALGLVLWPMVEFEADDAIAAAADRFADGPGGRADPHLHARQGHGPAASATSGSCSGTGAAASPTTTPGSSRSGACRPTSIPDWLALVGDCVRRLPGPARLGREVARPRSSRGTAHLEDDPGRRPPRGTCRASAAARVALAAVLREHWDEALAVPRPGPTPHADDGVPIPSASVDELRWHGAPRGDVGGVLRRLGPRPAARPAAPLARRRLRRRRSGRGQRSRTSASSAA